MMKGMKMFNEVKKFYENNKKEVQYVGLTIAVLVVLVIVF